MQYIVRQGALAAKDDKMEVITQSGNYETEEGYQDVEMQYQSD